MSRRRLLAFGGALLLSGCLYHAAERTDQTVCDLASHPYDLSPPTPVAPGGQAAGQIKTKTREQATDLRTAAVMEGEQPNPPAVSKPAVQVPEDMPAEDTPPLPLLPKDRVGREAAVRKIYPPLPALTEEATPLPGPGGKPYTLADLQHLAVVNSPTLRQAVSDVEAAKGNLMQAWAYPNPTVGYEVDPSSDGATPGTQGLYVDQPIKTGGKLKLQAAAAEKDLENAQLALKRARSDLATQVRNAYYGLLVAKETVRVTRALARFTDEVYQFQEDLLEKGGTAAPYEPAALRAQAYTARLSYKQALQTYAFSWKQLVAAVGVRQLPLTEVAGRIDAFIPFYDYDTVLVRVLKNHTDVLTAYNGIDKARYNLKLAQVTPAFPDLDVRVAVLKDFAVPPQGTTPTAQIGMPLPIWDQNRGAILAAESALARAGEEPHRVEQTLTANLATAYAGYENNLAALEYYRKYILPDLVRTVRGVEERRRFDQALSFADLVTAQQNLSTSVTSYLAILGQLWSSTVGVADLLQTDDLFQLAEPRELPPLPDLEGLPPLPCRHACAADATCASAPLLPAPVAQAPTVHQTATPTVVVDVADPPAELAPLPPIGAPPAPPPPSQLLEPPPDLHASPPPSPGE